METQGKVALVTGAARRVGRAVAIELARAGCNLALHYHTSVDHAEKLRDRIHEMGRGVTLFPADLNEPDAPNRLVDQIKHAMGGLDILINNAAQFQKTPLDEADDETWQRIFRVNTIAPAMLARAAAPLMREAGQGRIVNFTDILTERPIRDYAAYCASKAALASVTRSLAIELAPQITVNAIAPGIAVFPDDYDAATRANLMARVPLARQGTPEEVATLVHFLVADANYITGQVIPFDGGRSIRM